MPKEHLRQLFWRSTDLMLLRIIIVANRQTLPFSWGGGRRFVTGHRQIKGQTQGDYGPPSSTADLRKVYYNCKLRI